MDVYLLYYDAYEDTRVVGVYATEVLAKADRRVADAEWRVPDARDKHSDAVAIGVCYPRDTHGNAWKVYYFIERHAIAGGEVVERCGPTAE